MTGESQIMQFRLDRLQPSQLYISTEKLAEVLRSFDPDRPDSMEPIPLKRLDEDVVMTDGHTRAFAAFLCGAREVPAVWDEDELDWDAYRICVAWCKEAGVVTVANLVGRMLGADEYERLWRQRCQRMHEALAARRAAGGD
jgi:hypothetical protein